MNSNGNTFIPLLQVTSQQIRQVILGSEIGNDNLQQQQQPSNNVPATVLRTTLSDESKPQKSDSTVLPTPIINTTKIDINSTLCTLLQLYIDLHRFMF